jgi:hypothetical protein
MHRISLLGISLLVLPAVVTAQQAAPTGARVSTARTEAGATVPKAPAVLPGTRASSFSTIQGDALDSTGAPLPNSRVRLRDAHRGRIVGSRLTDALGAFTFGSLDPGSYVVELVEAERGRVLAASRIVNVNAGEGAATVVRLPTDATPFAGLIGQTSRQAAAIVSTAAAAGVLTSAGTTAVSGETPRLR